MKIEVVESSYWTSNGCDCCEDIEWDQYEVWIDGEHISTFSYKADALEYIMQMGIIDYEYVPKADPDEVVYDD